jgi:hypothetical protein
MLMMVLFVVRGIPACVLASVSMSSEHDVRWFSFYCGGGLSSKSFPKNGISLQTICLEDANGNEVCRSIGDEFVNADLKAARSNANSTMALSIAAVVYTFLAACVVKGEKRRLRNVASVALVLSIAAISTAAASMARARKVVDTVAKVLSAATDETCTVNTNAGTHQSGYGMIAASLALNCLGVVIVTWFGWGCKPSPAAAAAAASATAKNTAKAAAAADGGDKLAAAQQHQQQMQQVEQQMQIEQMQQQIQMLHQQLQQQHQHPQQHQPVPWEQVNPLARLDQPAALGVQHAPYAQVPAPFPAAAPFPATATVAQSSLSGVPMYGQLPFPATATAPVATAPVSAFPGPQPFPMYAPTDSMK